MAKASILLTVLLFGFICAAFGGIAYGETHMSKNAGETKIRIIFGNEEVIVALLDNPTSRDFLSLLPLAVTFEDYARTEKITYLPRRLTTSNVAPGDNIQGDFAYYAPWGNLAVFYEGFGRAGGLYILGRIESGKEKLANMNTDFSARIEIVK